MKVVEGKPWSRQAILKRQAIPTQEELLHRIRDIDNERDRALIAFAYLTGGRISEIVKEKHLRKNIYDTYIDDTGKKKTRKTEGGSYVIRDVKKVMINYPGVCKKDISYTFLDNRRIMLIDIQNRKNKKKLRKQIPIIIDKEYYFVKIIEGYVREMEPEQPLFPITKSRASQIMNKYFDMNCHFFRDIRATHLVTLHGLREHQLQMFMGWTDGRPAQAYVQLRWQDIWR